MPDSATYLPEGLPAPLPLPDGLDAPYWEGLAKGDLRVQRCRACRAWQWGPEWICHACLSFDLEFGPTAPQGRIYSWERVWHPVHPALRERPLPPGNAPPLRDRRGCRRCGARSG